MTTTTLVASGHAPRYSVDSVNAAEFFVTMWAATTATCRVLHAEAATDVVRLVSRDPDPSELKIN